MGHQSVTYVWTFARTDRSISAVQLLAQISLYILAGKVRSRALLFLYKLFFQLVYHVFYRNLVSSHPEVLVLVQLLSIFSSPA